MDLDYITSERFITDGLLSACQVIIGAMKEAWDRGDKITDFALSWPSKTVYTNNGKPIDKVVVLELPRKAEIKEAVQALSKRTSAYGLFLFEVREKEIYALFESMHLTRTWRLPIKWFGDRQILGDQVVQNNKDTFGLIWSPN